jgi:molybdate transport system permease protein
MARRDPKGAPPTILVLLGFLGALIVLLPLAGLLARTPWSRLGELLSQDIVADALELSLITSVAAAILSLVLGLPLAWVLSRTTFPGRSLLRAIVILPMVLPPVVGGAALLFALGRRGVVGEPIYDLTGFALPFSVWGVVLANTFVAMPFLVLTIEAALNNTDTDTEAAAATLGASRLVVFRRITLPLIRPSIAAGIVLAWARALGEFGATITFAGNLQGRTQTLPLAVFVNLETDRDAAIAISLMMVLVSVAVLLTLRNRWWSAQ